MSDKLRAALRGLIASVFPVLIVFHIAELTADQVAAIMLMIDYALTTLMLVWKTGQGVDPAGMATAAEGAAVAAAVAAETVSSGPVTQPPTISDRRGD